ncbi:MAG: efflux RND transporter periplasmic adaptor subunit [Candidatus Moranbacteria bacterium]|nr:efflux RND transporter periplasmic adaptor subunit [Candidatus Moranbacteria bacterium]
MSFLKKKWLWFVIALAIVGYFWYSSRNADQDLFVTTQVSRGDISQTVSASATLLSDTEIDLNFETVGRVKNIATKVGVSVSQGDVLSSIESLALNEEVKKSQAALDRAQADAGVNDDTLREAREVQKNAKQYVTDVTDAEDQKVDAADKAYDNAVEYELDVQSYYNQVVDDNGVSSSTAKSAKLTLTAAANATKAAREAKDTVRRNRDVAVRVADNAYASQKEKVKSLESKSQQAIENSAIAIASSNYDIAINNLDKAVLKAPVNGVVTVINYERGEVIGSGSVKSFGRLLSTDLILEAKIPESDIAAVKTDQTAAVTFDALESDEKLEASIVEIDPESTVIQDVVYYKVKLRLANIDRRLKPGMSGDIDIHIAEKKGVLTLPTRAVKQDGNTRYVEVKSADGKIAERREVKVGIEGSDGQIEIVSGVSEHQEVIVETKKQ